MSSDESRSFIDQQVEYPDEERARQRGRILTWGNGFSVLRVVLLPALLYEISLPVEDTLIPLLVLAFLIGLTDFLDGFLARKLNQVSDWGKILDPLADKICTAGLMVALYFYRGMPLWLPVFLIVRDIAIVYGGTVMFRKRDLVMPSNQLGRITTGIVTLLAVVYMFGFDWAQIPLLWVTGILMTLTVIIYTRNGILILRKTRD
jgi:CDP-diacylglycerol--glycerol-3-phosphate 3-phosphatidyltransferase